MGAVSRNFSSGTDRVQCGGMWRCKTTYNALTVLCRQPFYYRLCHGAIVAFSPSDYPFYSSRYSSSTAFLALPGIDTATRIVVLFSIAFTLASVMTGIYIQMQTGKIRFNSPVRLLGHAMNNNLISFQELLSQGPTLAILISIPFATLVWGVVLFAAAVIVYSLLGTQSTSDGTMTPFGYPTSIVVLACTSFLLVVICIPVFFFRLIRWKWSSISNESV